MSEIKKAFWAGFEISHSLGGTDIQARWNEYKELRGIKEQDNNDDLEEANPTEWYYRG